MAEMFGAPVGVSKALSDIRAQELHDLSLATGRVELEKSKIELSSQKQMLEMMKATEARSNPQGRMDKTYDLAGSMDVLANLALRSGLPDKAREYAVAGSTLRRTTDEIEKNRLEATIKHLNLIGSLMENVTDERSWQQANAMYQLQTGKPTPYAKMPYNPQTVEQLRMGVMSAKDRALTAAAKAREKSASAVTEEREARIPLIKAQTELTNQRTAALKKAGAVAKIPKASEVRAVTDLIIRDYGAAMLPEDARVLARPVAERMVNIMKESNLTQSEAAEQAYQEAKADGAFGGIRPRPQMSGTLQKPLEIPQKNGKPDAAKLRANMYYQGVGKFSGRTFLWTGGAFVPVGSGPGEIQPVDEDEDEVLDEDELEENPDDLEPALEP
jgi:hypothetical protein